MNIGKRETAVNIETLREKIDEIDRRLLELFEERMEVSGRIGACKLGEGLPVQDKKREKEKLDQVKSMVAAGKEASALILYDLLFELSRRYQKSLNAFRSPLYTEINRALEETPKLFPASATVACQGVEGAYSQQACGRLFKQPNILYFKNFDGVFSAIQSGLCDYGILPLENSTAGSVNKIYDLMQKHRFYIVRSIRLKINHNLLAPEGVELEEVREIFSHEQAISQCSALLESLGSHVKVTRVENTAQAARAVAESGRRDAAAIASQSCQEIYGLNCLARDVQDRDNNYTRFICISRDLQIYPGADRTSIMLVLPHQPGSLYKALSRFYALGISLNKLESRPIPNRDFEFMFYFDLETSVYSEELLQLLDGLRESCEDFTYLGSYTEVI